MKDVAWTEDWVGPRTLAQGDGDDGAWQPVRMRLLKLMGPLRCGTCGVRLTAGDPGHPDHGPAVPPPPGCTCERFVRALTEGRTTPT